jgi:hypothetical protein
MPLSPAQRKLLHYTGYVYPTVFIGLGVGGLIAGVFARTPVGTIVLGLLGVSAIALGGFLMWRHSRQDFTTPVPTLDDYPLQEQARQIRTSVRLIAVVTVLFGAYVAYQVMQVEYGWAQSVRTWGPVADLYNSLGFWPAVLCIPGLGLLTLLALAWKLRSIREKMPSTMRSQ